MMRIINAHNVNEALYMGTMLMVQIEEDGNGGVAPRGSRTIECPERVTTVYSEPWNRVVFSAARDANPFFHLMESMWILSGRRDVPWLAQFNARIADYSDDGQVFHAAYGYRLRHQQKFDQIEAVISLLKGEPDTRRAVLQIWDADLDLNLAPDTSPDEHYSKQLAHKDIPCNDIVCFKIRNGRLRMTVYNRSNDMIWGAYGANAVQFSFLQEYIAANVGCYIGSYAQVSDSYHVYLDDAGGRVWERVKASYNDGGLYLSDAYAFVDGVKADVPLIRDPFLFDVELEQFMEDGPHAVYTEPFVEWVLKPAFHAWRCYKAQRMHKALSLAHRIQSTDWQKACTEWLLRRRT